MPFVSQPSLAPGMEWSYGLSDITVSTFFSPSKSDLVWGVGPALVLPTTDDPTLGSGKWQAGPTAVRHNVLAQFRIHIRSQGG